MSVLEPERGGRCLAAPASPDPVVKAGREAAWHGRQKAESGPGSGEGARRTGGESGGPRPGPPSYRPAPAESGRSRASLRGEPRPRTLRACCPAPAHWPPPPPYRRRRVGRQRPERVPGVPRPGGPLEFRRAALDGMERGVLRSWGSARCGEGPSDGQASNWGRKNK